MSLDLRLRDPLGERRVAPDELPLSLGGEGAAIAVPGVDPGIVLGWIGIDEDGLYVEPPATIPEGGELRLDGRLALVTGGNAGIGFATCRGLLERGARVVMLSRNVSKAREACRQLDRETGAGERIASVAMDLAEPSSILEAVRQLGLYWLILNENPRAGGG